ncbi:MAG: SH3 domain-containing protein [Proteobacteria bacterium]|nr:SH3 domain-containing protein [Pseudomonadota bacterium]
MLAFAGGSVFAVKDTLLAGRGPQAIPGDVTGSVDPAVQQVGKVTNLPVPRFVTLKTSKVNVRRGPSSDHEVAFVFQRKGMPVEITGEFENWRKIRDSDGAEGWILQSMLSGKRNAFVASWSKDQQVVLHAQKDPGSASTAILQAGVVAAIDGCDGQWCAIEADGHGGFAEQSLLWGVYPGEVVN